MAESQWKLVDRQRTKPDNKDKISKVREDFPTPEHQEYITSKRIADRRAYYHMKHTHPLWTREKIVQNLKAIYPLAHQDWIPRFIGPAVKLIKSSRRAVHESPWGNQFIDDAYQARVKSGADINTWASALDILPRHLNMFEKGVLPFNQKIKDDISAIVNTVHNIEYQDTHNNAKFNRRH